MGKKKTDDLDSLAAELGIGDDDDDKKDSKVDTKIDENPKSSKTSKPAAEKSSKKSEAKADSKKSTTAKAPAKKEEESDSEYQTFSISSIKPFHNYREAKNRSGENIEELKASIKAEGLLVAPSVVIRKKKPFVIDGSRRLYALTKLGEKEVVCKVVSVEDDNDTFRKGLIHNIQRQNLSPIEEGKAYKALLDKKIFKTQKALAKAVGLSEFRISTKMATLDLPPKIKKQIEEGEISESKAMALQLAEKSGKTVDEKTAKKKSAKKIKKDISNPSTMVPGTDLPENIGLRVFSDKIVAIITINNSSKSAKGFSIKKAMGTVVKPIKDAEIAGMIRVIRKEF